MKLKLSLSKSWQSYDIAIWVRVFGTALTSLTGFMMRPFLALYLYDQMDGSILLPMVIVGLQPFCGMLVNLYAGGLSDRWGRKPVMLLSLIIQALSLGGYILADTVWHYAALSIINGIGGALFMPAANAQVTDVVPEEKRPEVFALFHTALNVGAAIGPLIGLVLYTWNPNIVFLICSLSTFIYALTVWWKVPETLARPSDYASSAVSAASAASAQSNGRTSKPRIRLRNHRTLLWITVFALPVTLLYAQVESTFPLHLQTRFEDYKSIYATLMTFNGLTVITLQMWVAKRSRHIPAHRVVLVAYSIFALVSLGYGFMPYFALLLAVEFLFTVAEMIYGPHMQKIVSVIAPPEHRGFYFSIYGMNWQFARAIGPVLGGLLLSRANGEIMFAFFALLIAISGCVMYIITRRLEQPKVHKEALPASPSTASA